MSNYDECMKCGALTDRIVKHKRWHSELEEQVEALESQVADLEVAK